MNTELSCSIVMAGRLSKLCGKVGMYFEKIFRCEISGSSN